MLTPRTIRHEDGRATRLAQRRQGWTAAVTVSSTLPLMLTGPLGWSPQAWLQLFLHFGLLSLLAIGGAITTVPDMHRYIVAERGWLSDASFSGSIALAQAAPGPNVLFVAVIGFNVAGLAGVVATLGGSLLPSTVLAVKAGRYGALHHRRRSVRAFTESLAPLTLGLLLATAWVLTEASRHRWGTLPLVLGTVWLMQRTRISPVWPILLGAAAGLMGWV